MENKLNFVLPKKYQLWAYLLMIVGFLTFVVGFYFDPTRMWINLLINNFYFVSISLCAMFFLSLMYVANAGWSSCLKRVPEAMTSFLPYALVLMLLLYFGMHSLYHWSHEEVVLQDPVLQHKSVFLNIPGFFMRMVVYFGLWILFAKMLRQNSLLQDKDPSFIYQRRNIRNSAIFIWVFALTLSLASIDWLQSVEPHWFSTIYGIYTFSSLFLHGLAFMTLIVIVLKEKGFFQGLINENHLHDLGKLIFAFSTFWAYIWVSQYLLIWYSNIPEETAYYYVRTDNEWSWLFVLNLALNWILPFLILMPREAKRSAAVLKRVCVCLLIGYWLDLFLLVAPHVVKARQIGIFEILISLGFGSFFVLVTAKALEKAPLIPLHDPYLQESLHFHQ